MQPDRFTVKSQEAVAAAQALAAEPAQPRGRLRPTCCSRCSTRTRASSSRSCRSSAPTPARSRARAQRGGRGAAEAGGDDAPSVRPSSTFVAVLQQAEKEMAKLGDEYISTEHLLLALADDGSGVADLLPDRDALEQAVAEVRGPHQVTSPEPRGQRPGAGEIRPRPDRRGRGGQARPGDRPRRGDPPRDPGPLPPDQEQPGADRRPRRRQDGDRRGPGAADRRRATCPRACATAA